MTTQDCQRLNEIVDGLPSRRNHPGYWMVAPDGASDDAPVYTDDYFQSMDDDGDDPEMTAALDYMEREVNAALNAYGFDWLMSGRILGPYHGSPLLFDPVELCQAVADDAWARFCA